ncbi:MAG: SRPBCC domain-containing protein [Cytophagales bacterium]|nr:SRPBCC domain-containing protein [Cytophagales bacterium]
MKKFRTEILIDAPVELVWRLLMDFQNYWHWNTHLPYWEGKPQPGKHLYITSFLNEKPVRFAAQITEIEAHCRFSFTETVASPIIFKADHTIELQAVSPTSCRVVQQESLEGLLMRLVWKKWLHKALRCYGQMNRDLKLIAENQYNGRLVADNSNRSATV